MSFRSLKLLDPSEVPSRVQLLNPFVHKLEMDNPVDKIKTAIFTVLLLPFRVICICILLIVAWILACIGLCGMTQEVLKNRPMIGWRRMLKYLISMILRWTYLAGGISIKVYGKQASRNEAPILVIAPHTTFLDSIIVYVTNMSSIIVRMESMDNYIGKLINFTQPIYVWRDDPNSRQNTIKSIIERAKSEEDWAQILIFPEGTCTNRSCLIEFKPGAFYPGVPIQPVCIRYPNKLDTVTWTWEGPGVLKLLWLTLTQIHSSCEIEFLPVYHPSEEEKNNPKLYAHNVRNIMSKALDIPTSEYTFDDCRLMTRAKNMNLPCAVGIVDFAKLRKAIGLDKTNIEENIVCSTSVNDTNYNINITEFSLLLKIPIDDNSKKLFSLFDREECGIIDFREYLLCAIFIIKSHEPVIKLIYYAFKIYENTSIATGCLNADSIYRLFKHTMAMSSQESAQLFLSIDVTNRGYITFDEFAAYGKTEYAFLFRTENDGKTTKKVENNNEIIKDKDN